MSECNCAGEPDAIAAAWVARIREDARERAARVADDYAKSVAEPDRRTAAHAIAAMIRRET